MPTGRKLTEEQKRKMQEGAARARAERKARGTAAKNLPPPPKPVEDAAPLVRTNFQVQLPAGGRLTLQDAEEVELWEEAAKRYIDDYGLARANDLMLLGAILSQGIAMFRAQRLMADSEKAATSQGIIIKAAEEIRALEKALGIDKKTREQGGQHTVADYITRLKRAAHTKGVHIAERITAYEAVMMEARWKIRLLRNGDEEDKAYHGLTEASIVEWLETELSKLEEADKEWNKTKAAVFVGRL